MGLEPGSDHYRAFIGPPAQYDLVSAMVFNLLTCIGMRQHHRVLDVGCGSLRSGRLLIPYLNKGNYFGVEPNRWLVQAGIDQEIGQDMVRIKDPTFSFKTSMEDFTTPLNLDFAFAQSIFSHCGRDLISQWLGQIFPHLSESGALLATFVKDATDFPGSGWIYPGCVNYKPETMAQLAAKFGFGFQILDWAHPRQTWALFSRKNFDGSLAGGAITWNRLVAKVMAAERK